jgi:hypothetical protein
MAKTKASAKKQAFAELNAKLLEASRCVNRGWAIFPADLRNGAKKSYKSAEYSNGRPWGKTTDPDEIYRDFKRWPEAGIGIPTGAEAGIFVVECDTPKGHGVDGLASLKALQAKHGKLPKTRMAESPSGSVHRYYKHPGPRYKITSRALAGYPGIDIKGDGGMVIAPPSKRADGVYKWINNAPIANPPGWLVDLTITAAQNNSGSAPKNNGGGSEKDFYEQYGDELRKPVPIDKIAFMLLEVLPNNDVCWEEWNEVGMANGQAHRMTAALHCSMRGRRSRRSTWRRLRVRPASSGPRRSGRTILSARRLTDLDTLKSLSANYFICAIRSNLVGASDMKPAARRHPSKPN